MRSNAAEYPETSAFKPVKLKRSTMYSSSISQKYSLPLDARNHLGDRDARGSRPVSRELGTRRDEVLTRSTSWCRIVKRTVTSRPLRRAQGSRERSVKEARETECATEGYAHSRWFDLEVRRSASLFEVVSGRARRSSARGNGSKDETWWWWSQCGSATATTSGSRQ